MAPLGRGSLRIMRVVAPPVLVPAEDPSTMVQDCEILSLSSESSGDSEELRVMISSAVRSCERRARRSLVEEDADGDADGDGDEKGRS